ncbi:MAG: hypothetical protein JO356_02795 [Acidobacteria bacterium]|nr:hypothetical protein [Acidobacteriota bacterium]
MTEKPREMTLPAIRKRLDLGSWDSADFDWLCRKAKEHADMAKVLHAAWHALKSYEYGNAATELAKECAAEIEKVLKEAGVDKKP